MFIITDTTENLPDEAGPCLLKIQDETIRSRWIARFFHQKTAFALDSIEGMTFEALVRLAETSRRRKFPVPILHSYRFHPVFARLKELANSGCLGKLERLTINVPAPFLPWPGADLAAWLKSPWTDNDEWTTVPDVSLSIKLVGTAGWAVALLDKTDFSGELDIHLEQHSHELAFKPVNPYKIEREILENTEPYKHHWPLLMQATDLLAALKFIDICKFSPQQFEK